MDWGELIQSVLETVLAIALPILIGYIAMWLRARQKEILANLSTEQRWVMDNAIEMAVKAAKQSGLKGHIEDVGRVKKRFALDAAERYLFDRGLGGIDLDVLSDMIEAECYRQFKEPADTPIPLPPIVDQTPPDQAPVSW